MSRFIRRSCSIPSGPLRILLLALLFLTPNVVRAQSQVPVLEILNESLVVDPNPEQENQMALTLLVKNNGSETRELLFRAVGNDGAKMEIDPASGTIQPYDVASFTLHFNGVSKTTKGFLIVGAEGVTPASKPLTLNPPPKPIMGVLTNPKMDANWVLLVSFLTGVLGFSILVWSFIASHFRNLKKPWTGKDLRRARLINERDWDFKENWASTFGLLGGLFGSIVGSSLLPATPKMLSKEEFQFLNLLFPGLILLAPFILSALNSLGHELRKEDNQLILTPDLKIPIYIFPFVLSSAIVIWAVTGELLGLLALITELNQAGILSNGITLTGQLLIVFFLLAGLYYAGERVVQTAETAKKEEDILKEPPKPKVEGLDLGKQEPQRKLYLP